MTPGGRTVDVGMPRGRKSSGLAAVTSPRQAEARCPSSHLELKGLSLLSEHAYLRVIKTETSLLETPK